jgi:hypothetical protein
MHQKIVPERRSWAICAVARAGSTWIMRVYRQGCMD